MSDPNQNTIDPQILTQQIAASYVDDYMPPVTTQPAAPAAPPAKVEEPLPPMVEEKPLPPMEVTPPAAPTPAPVTSQAVPPTPTPPILPPEPEKPWPKQEEKQPEQGSKAVLPQEEVATTPDTAPIPEKTTPQVPQAQPDQKNDDKAPIFTKRETPQPPAAPKESKSADNDQSLESQNIFHMLGIEDANEEDKEMFLDELQQIIWEDFLKNDVDLLLTEEEKVDFNKIQENDALEEDERQTAMVEFLEKLVPDLEKIMLEKALELKEEMFAERITQLKKDSADKPDASRITAELAKAEQFQKDHKWLDAANTLNAIAH